MRISNVTLQPDTAGVLTRMGKSGGEQGKAAGPCVITPVRYMLLWCWPRCRRCCCYWCILHRLRITVQYVHSYVWFVLTVELC